MALACMLWRSSVRTTSPVSAALRTLMKNTPLWSAAPVWHGQSGPVAPSWHHPQAKKKTNSASLWKDFSFDLTKVCKWLRGSSCTCLPPKSSETKSSQNPTLKLWHLRVHHFLWFWGIWLSLLGSNVEDFFKLLYALTKLKIFLKVHLLFYIQALRCSDVWSWRGLDGVPLTIDQSATAEEAVGHPLWRFSEN